MNSIEVTLNQQKFDLISDEPVQHIEEVSELVQRKLDSLKKKNPSYSSTKIALLVAFDLASENIKRHRKSSEFRSSVVAQSTAVLEGIEKLKSATSGN